MSKDKDITEVWRYKCGHTTTGGTDCGLCGAYRYEGCSAPWY